MRWRSVPLEKDGWDVEAEVGGQADRNGLNSSMPLQKHR